MHAVDVIRRRLQNNAHACHPRPCTRTCGPDVIAARGTCCNGRATLDRIRTDWSGTRRKRALAGVLALSRRSDATWRLIHYSSVNDCGGRGTFTPVSFVSVDLSPWLWLRSTAKTNVPPPSGNRSFPLPESS